MIELNYFFMVAPQKGELKSRRPNRGRNSQFTYLGRINLILLVNRDIRARTNSVLCIFI